MISEVSKRPTIALVSEERRPQRSIEADAMRRQASRLDIEVVTVPFPFDTVDDTVEALVVPPRYSLTNAAVQFFPHLRYVGVPSVGMDHVLDFASRHPEVTVLNAPGFNTEEVAEHTMSFILMLLRGIPEGQIIVEAGRWDSRATDGRRWDESAIGLVGFGAIARRVSEICLALGLTVVVWNRSPVAAVGADRRIVQVDSLSDLLKTADIVSLHVPDTPETHHLIDADALEMMRPTASVVNVGRGGLISEPDLAAALDEKRIRSAALDVLEVEPPDGSSPLLGRADVVITPHSAWYSAKSSVRAYEIVTGRIAALLAE